MARPAGFACVALAKAIACMVVGCFLAIGFSFSFQIFLKYVRSNCTTHIQLKTCNHISIKKSIFIYIVVVATDDLIHYYVSQTVGSYA